MKVSNRKKELDMIKSSTISWDRMGGYGYFANFKGTDYSMVFETVCDEEFEDAIWFQLTVEKELPFGQEPLKDVIVSKSTNFLRKLAEIKAKDLDGTFVNGRSIYAEGEKEFDYHAHFRGDDAFELHLHLESLHRKTPEYKEMMSLVPDIEKQIREEFKAGNHGKVLELWNNATLKSNDLAIALHQTGIAELLAESLKHHGKNRG